MNSVNRFILWLIALLIARDYLLVAIKITKVANKADLIDVNVEHRVRNAFMVCLAIGLTYCIVSISFQFFLDSNSVVEKVWYTCTYCVETILVLILIVAYSAGWVLLRKAVIKNNL